MPEMLKSSKSAIDKRLLQKSPFEKLCSDIIPALVEALVKVILYFIINIRYVVITGNL